MEKIWSWPLQASPHDITKMIQTFHQISGQLGCKNKGSSWVLAPCLLLYSTILVLTAFSFSRGQPSRFSGQAQQILPNHLWTTKATSALSILGTAMSPPFYYHTQIACCHETKRGSYGFISFSALLLLLTLLSVKETGKKQVSYISEHSHGFNRQRARLSRIVPSVDRKCAFIIDYGLTP